MGIIKDATSMEGMIFRANEVLQDALNPGVKGIPKGLFRAAKAIAILSVVEAGFIFTGNVGTGILLAKLDDNNTWSPPNAIGLTGVGWGFLVGGSVKSVLVFLLDDMAVQQAMTENGVKFGGQAELTLGIGRTGEIDLNVSGKGISGTVSVAYTKGAFGGVGVEGAVCGTREAANRAFYGDDIAPRDILRGKVHLPDKVTMLQEVYSKLGKLAEGATVAEIPLKETEKKSLAQSAAESASEQVNTSEAVVLVDGVQEAKKETQEAEDPISPITQRKSEDLPEGSVYQECVPW